MLYRRSKFAKPFLLTTFCLFWMVCTPYFTEGAMHLLEARTVALDGKPPVADAIVILGGGTYFNAPEYAKQDTVTGFVLERLRYGAKLGRETDTPILVTGGRPLDSDTAEAVLMQRVLEQEFHIPVRWIEDGSNNTYENAHYSFQTLQKSGIKKIYLVTHAWHMPRAAAIFRKVGFEVVEAPTAFSTRYQIDLLAFLPQAEAMQNSKIAAHEVIGMLWYRLKSSLTNQTLKEKPI